MFRWWPAVLLSLISISPCISARSYAIVAKSLDDGNFTAVWQGCNEAALREGDDCILVGHHGPAHPRLQTLALQKALAEHTFAGIAVSVTKSDLIASALQATEAPVVTYDSDFDQAHQPLRKTFVGMDNGRIGRELADMAKTLYPDGATVCIMTTLFHPNIRERESAFRKALSGDENFPENRRLTGENGWQECSRSPMNTGSDSSHAVHALEQALYAIRPQLLVSTGHWPVVNETLFRTAVAPLSNQLKNRQTSLLLVAGPATAYIHNLTEEGLVRGYVYQDFHRTGAAVYQVMKDLSEKRTVTESILIPSQTVLPD